MGYADMLAFLTLALELTPRIVAAGMDLQEFVSRMIAVSKQEGGPTKEDWDALHAKETELRAMLNNPAP